MSDRKSGIFFEPNTEIGKMTVSGQAPDRRKAS